MTIRTHTVDAALSESEVVQELITKGFLTYVPQQGEEIVLQPPYTKTDNGDNTITYEQEDGMM